MKAIILILIPIAMIFTNVSCNPVAEQTVILQHPTAVLRIAFSLDKSELITAEGGNGIVRIWNIQRGEVTREIPQYHFPIAVSNSGELFAIRTERGDMGLLLENYETGEGFRWFPTGIPFFELSFSPNDEYVAVGGALSRTVAVWNVSRGLTSQRILGGNTAKVEAISFSPDSQHLAIGSFDGSVTIWSVATGRLDQTVRESVKRGFGMPGLVDLEYIPAHSAQKATLAVADGSSISIWDIDLKKVIRTFHGHQALITSMNISASGQYLMTGSADNTIRIWDVDTGETIKIFYGHENAVNDVTFSNDGSLIASAGDDGTARVWDISALEIY